MSQTGPRVVPQRVGQPSAPLTTSRVVGLIGLVLLAGIVAALASSGTDLAVVVPIVALISALLFVAEFLDPGHRLGASTSIGLYVGAIALAATTGPALAGMVTLAGTSPLLFLNNRRWSVPDRLLTDVAASMVTTAAFWGLEHSRSATGDWPFWGTIPLQSALALVVVLLIRRIPGAPYQERLVSRGDLFRIVVPIAAIAVALEAGLTDRHPVFVTAVFLIVLASLCVLARLLSRGHATSTHAVEGLVAALSLGHPDISAHSNRVFALVSRMLDGVPGIAPGERTAILTAALIHDIGKLATPDQALLKPGALTVAERKVMQQHSAIGEEIVRRLDGLAETAPIVRHHHERWDGAGYPDGLVGPVIPLGARMIAVADTYDAMTHDRVYRRALGHNEALAELFAQRGRQFDPGVVDVFTRILTTDQTERSSGTSARTIAS